ncbi:unnamed protein product [Protopolystoma xenopodis]|uniref:Uncharacterized protein n=1 Tax=Protopolystoma xenopodis TaxID=117903 RepID=A0A3S5A6B8_9PLAT|nr:unnamed protein product [Protopolystoma xenopodis]
MISFIAICCVAYDAYRIVSGSTDTTICVWNARTNANWSTQTLRGHSGAVRCLQLLPSRANSVVRNSTSNDIANNRINTGRCIKPGVAKSSVLRSQSLDSSSVLAVSHDNINTDCCLSTVSPPQFLPADTYGKSSLSPSLDPLSDSTGRLTETVSPLTTPSYLSSPSSSSSSFGLVSSFPSKLPIKSSDTTPVSNATCESQTISSPFLSSPSLPFLGDGMSSNDATKDCPCSAASLNVSATDTQFPFPRNSSSEAAFRLEEEEEEEEEMRGQSEKNIKNFASAQFHLCGLSVKGVYLQEPNSFTLK